MRMAIILVAVLIGALGFSATNALAKDEVYRWVDEDGVVHFGDLPDEHSNAETINIRTSQDLDAQTQSGAVQQDTGQQPEPQPSYAQQLRDERAENRREAAEKQQDIDAGCEQRRRIVANLEPSTRVMVRLEDGSVIRMDDNERLETLAEAKDYIAEKCNK